MPSDGLEGMYEGDFADACAEKIPLVSMGGTSDPIQYGQTGSEDPIRACRFKKIYQRKLINIFSSYEITKENKIRRILVP